MIHSLLPILAQAGSLGSVAGTNPTTVRDVIVVLLAGLSAAALMTPWFQRRRTSTTLEDQPIRVSAAPKYVSLEDHEEATRALAERISRVEALMLEIRREAKADREHLTHEMLNLERRLADSAVRRDENTHKRINDLVETVSGLVGEVRTLAGEIRGRRP